MTAELDYDLTVDQWEMLKEIRLEQRSRKPPALALRRLAELALVESIDGRLRLTDLGRRVLVRGSSRLLDLAA